MRTAAAKFFTATHFAVAGASSNPSKYGHRIFAWYLTKKLSPIPINPSRSTIEVRRKEFATTASPTQLKDPQITSLSIITPPPVTAKLLREAKEAGVLAVWLQPGSFTDEILQYALEAFPGAAIGGFEAGTVGGEGWCVLVDGDAAITMARELRTNDTESEGSNERKRKRQVASDTLAETRSDSEIVAENRVSNLHRRRPLTGRYTVTGAMNNAYTSGRRRELAKRQRSAEG
jgi:predicted CoA-binding protein